MTVTSTLGAYCNESPDCHIVGPHPHHQDGTDVIGRYRVRYITRINGDAVIREVTIAGVLGDVWAYLSSSVVSDVTVTELNDRFGGGTVVFDSTGRA